MQLGDQIRTKRCEKKLRQYQVADATGLSRNYISDIECGKNTPSVDTLARLAFVLDLDLNALLKMTVIQVLPDRRKGIHHGKNHSIS